MKHTTANLGRGTTCAAIAVALGLAACGGDDDGRGTAGGSGISSIGSQGGGSQESGGTAVESDGGEADSAGESLGEGGTTPLFDLGSADDGTGPTPDDGCKRVDFLFVIDNSVSMQDNQASLVGAFPGFMDAIAATLSADSDYHIMVTDTDAWGRCNTVNGFVGNDPSSNTCDNYIKTTAFEECDAVRGAGVIHPAGQYSSDALCTLAGGNRYIEPGEPDLGAAFACVATVGVAGHPSERPMDGMIAALSPELNMAGACNEGFLRDDALLVVAFVSDDPNYEDSGTPQEWYDAVVDAKLGDPSSVVVLGLTPAWDGCATSGQTRGEHWAEFVGLWGDHGVHGNVCGTAEEYVAFFQSAVSTIDQACDDYNPPG
ncbi:MAG: hypothetical protein IPK74_31495 [Deltaproteobacteria bacterium]|nr:hypothetical protein [Deltaproteobacteria bacterium]